MRRITLAVLAILLFPSCLPAQPRNDEQRLGLEGAIDELLNDGKIEYCLIENGDTIGEGAISGKFLLLPESVNKRKISIFIKASGRPPFLIPLEGKQSKLAIEKQEQRKAKLHLSSYPQNAQMVWFLKSWRNIPPDLYPILKCGDHDGKSAMFPAGEDVQIEIRAKGILPYYGTLKIGQTSFQPEPSVAGWCREVRVRNKEGMPLKGIFSAFLEKIPWNEDLPHGKACLTDEFGRAVLKQENVDASGMIVVMGADYKPFYSYSDKPSATPVALKLQDGGRLTGKVVDEGGRPIKAILSFPVVFDHPQMKAGLIDIQTKEDGTFAFPMPSTGNEYPLSVAAEGCEKQSIGLKGAKSPLVIRLKREMPLKGVVEDRDGNPVAGAVIHIGDKEFQSDNRGNFSLNNLGDQESGWVEALGFFMGSFKIDRKQEFIKVVLEKGNGGIKARLVDTEGNPVEEAMPAVKLKSEGMEGASGQPRRKYKNGNFQFPLSLSFGKKSADFTADLTLFSDGFKPVTQKEIKIPAGEIVDLGTLVFERGLSITGKVKLEDGTPAAGAQITLVEIYEDPGRRTSNNTRFEKEQSGWTAPSDGFGEFNMDGLYKGTFMVFIDYPGYAEYEDSVNISSSASIGEFYMGKGIDLTIKILSKNGEPKNGFLVKAYPEDDPFGLESNQLLTSSEGTVTLEGQKEGTYKIEVSNSRNELLVKDTFRLEEYSKYKEIHLPGEKVELTVLYEGLPVANQYFCIAAIPQNAGFGYYLPDSYTSSASISSGNRIYKVRTDIRGIIELEDFESGDYLLFSGESVYQASKSFRFGEESTGPVEIKGFTAKGKLTGRPEDNVGNIMIPLYRRISIGPPVIITRSDTNGNFCFNNLEPGSYSIWLPFNNAHDQSSTTFDISASDIILEPIEYGN